MAKLLDQIILPAGLKSLKLAELEQLANELRDELIDSVAESGGHFASSLGATEISVATHHLFNSPTDKIIWDVGHQAYVHKMLTGRRDKLGSIRLKGGISGFLKRDESNHDAFGAGHAGTSISAAVGMREALKNSDNYVVAVIGDGSLTSGMAFEALNHAGHLRLDRFIVILNDNEMSISPNVGALSWMFSRTITSKTSTRARSLFKSLYKKGYVPEFLYQWVNRAEDATQGFFATPAMLFESFGFRYIGPVDGHNISELTTALTNAKRQEGPVLIHAHTVKGKGYEPAEEDPIKWHGVSPFDRKKAVFIGGPSPKAAPSYTSVFSDCMIELARLKPEVVAITAAMPGGTGLDRFQNEHPDKFYDVGICEQHAVTFAAGLACAGKKPVCAIYSTFLQRAFDQVVHDVCIQNLPVVFAMDRSGLVGNDGETHQGVFDIAYLRTLPNIVLMSPKNENELRHMLYTAINHDGPIALRYPRGNGSGVELDRELQQLTIGKAEVVQHGEDVLLICYGPLVQCGLRVASNLKAERGINATVINARFAKPIDRELFAKELVRHNIVCTLEDHSLQGGFGSALLEFINEKAIVLETPVQMFGVGDYFVAHASQSEQHALCGFDSASISESILKLLPPRLGLQINGAVNKTPVNW